MNVIALQEVRWPGNNNIRKGDTIILYSGTDNDRHEIGISFIVHNDIYKNIKKFKTINDLICYFYIKGRLFEIII